MLSFANDYAEGAHEQILTRLLETNLEPLSGYGTDKYCDRAKRSIQAACECPAAEIFFLAGGTQTNTVVISSLLHGCEGVIAARTGHICTHEAGAIENSGHKVLEIPHHDGRIDAAELDLYLRNFRADVTHEHMVYPGMVYISHPTEYGTLYRKDELSKIAAVCRENQIPLYLDGARLGYGLMSSDTDVTLPLIAAYCDVFYIGGTKVGALCGEAVVFTRGNTPRHFITTVKQHGALLAKGRLLGIQFDTLFSDRLYFTISRHAIAMAELLKQLFIECGYTFFLDSPTNQQFIILENNKMAQLQQHVLFSPWEKYDETHTVVRFATSWATTPEAIRRLKKYL